METIKVRANAKINLSLDITGKREDGYHELDSVMMSVGVYDTLTFKKTDTPGIELACTSDGIPLDRTNIIYKCAEALFEKYVLTEKAGVFIIVDKNIPTQAGMGGGSADGAAALVALNRLFELNADEKRLMEIGASIGADIPFCIRGGCCRCQGIGEVLTDIKLKSEIPLVIIKPDAAVSTPQAYKDYDGLISPAHCDTEILINALESGDIKNIGGHLFNSFEDVVKESSVNDARILLKQKGALSALMTGSGSAVFGIFESMKKAELAHRYLQGFGYSKGFVCTNVSHGVEIIAKG